MVEESRVPGRWLYLLALLIFVIGIMAATMWLLVDIVILGVATSDFEVPATGEINVRRSGRYSVDCYYTWEGTPVGTLPAAPALMVNLSSAATGDRVPPIESDIRVSRQPDAYSGTATYDFEIVQPGDYTLTIGTRGDGRVPASWGRLAEPKMEASFGPSTHTVLVALLRISALVVASFIAGLALALTTHVRRHRAIRRAAAGQREPISVAALDGFSRAQPGDPGAQRTPEA